MALLMSLPRVRSRPAVVPSLRSLAALHPDHLILLASDLHAANDGDVGQRPMPLGSCR